MAGLEGQTLGSYEILAKLGQGGMGAVYKARDTRLQRFVAIKVLPVQLATDEEFVQRFQREAIAAAQFCHSNLVQVFDIGESNELHFIVMELVEGESLGHRLQRKGRMPPREAIAVTIYIGQALAYAWNKAKLIHRDIKPANIFLSKDGEVKLGDLGLAKSLQDAASGLTLSGTIMGTPHYMSPEQGRGDKQMDCRSDIYSLGCVLYHMLTGQPPYQGDSTATLIYKHVHEAPPPLRAAAPDCPEDLAETVDWMMAKKPEDRPQTYEEMLAELAAVRHALLHAPAAAPKPAAPKATPANVPSHAPVTMAEKKAPSANEAKSPSFGLIVTGTVVVSVLVLGLLFWSPWKANSPPVVLSSSTMTQQPPAVSAPAPQGGFMEEVAALPTEQQVKRVLAKLKELNPEFDGQEKHRVESNTVVALALSAVAVANLAPVRALRGLRRLVCAGEKDANGAESRRGRLADLGPLRGLLLEEVDFSCTQVADLSPLKGMSLKTVDVGLCPVSNLTSLAGMPLVELRFHSTRVGDLTALRGMPLRRLCCNSTDPRIRELVPLRGMPLEELTMNGAAVSDLSPLQGMPLTRLTCDSTLVRDLSPLKGLPLRSLSIQNVPAKDFTPLRSLASLIKINGLPAVEFWKQVDAGKASATDDMAWKDAINLLSLVELPKGVRYGKWERRNNTIAVQVDKAYAQLAFPYRPPAEYDYRVTFVCSQGQGIVLILYREGHQLTFQLGIHGMTGFEVIDGAHVAEAPGTIKRKQMVSLDSTHIALVQVRNDGLRAFLDGKQLIECTTDYRDVHSHEDWKLPENTPVGIGTTGSTVEFLAAEIREVTGKGSFMRGAPAQPGSSPAVKQEIKSLFNGRNLTGWRARDTNKKNEWSVRSGTLICTKPGPDLLTEEQFMDFLFHCEFKLSPAANSGVYLRGRYEIQLQDDHGKPVTEQSSGGLYKVIAPSVNAIKPAGVWQTLDAAVAGQRVQIILNGKKVIENGLLSKPTVGALDQNIDQAGPLLLQGFMGQVEFRNLLLMPLNPGVNLQTLTFPAGWPNPRRN